MHDYFHLDLLKVWEEPRQHRRYERETRTFGPVEGRRPAGHVVASGQSKAFDDPGIFAEMLRVKQILPRGSGLAGGRCKGTRRGTRHFAA